MNIGILLAAGYGSRFDSETPKQLYQINGKEIIYHSIDAMSHSLDEMIIVSNSCCCDKIKTESVVLINDVNCRLQSIKTALDYIGNKKVSNIIIHDSARPFITKDHIDNLLASSKKFLYSQYYLKLINGLVKKTDTGHEVVNRDQFIELCTPQIIDYGLYNFIFRKYIDGPDRIACEFITMANFFGIDYNLIEGHHRHLRKITTIHDI